jgi:hypothetical protein
VTNGLVEIGLILTTAVLTFLGLPVWLLGVMIGIALSWWSFVHAHRLRAMVQTNPIRALGQIVLAIVVVSVCHGIAFALAGAFGMFILGGL